MSNFPIISTTPPPLDVNDNEAEEEEEESNFRNFNDISSEEEKDIDFVIPDFTNDNETDGQTVTSTDLNDKITYKENQNFEEINFKSFDNKNINSSDNNSDTQKEVIERDDNLTENTENDFNVLDDNIIEKSSEEKIKEMDDEEEFSDFNGVNIDENDFDFADFTSYQLTECKENVKQIDKNECLALDQSFGDFKDSSQTNGDTNVSKDIEFSDNLSDDDFADFASAQPELNSDFQSFTTFKSNIRHQNEFTISDDEFADFSSFQEVVDNTVDNTTSSNCQTSQEFEKLSQLFNEIFISSEPIDSVDNSPNISRDLFNGQDHLSKHLWKQLQDVESAPSLRLKWSTSHSFQLLLTALNIDPRNILRNPSVPMFASGLGYVLEPTKHKFDDLNDEFELKNTNGLNTCISIPPVHFDWSSSGLTNPLDANQKSMDAFDLDFFVTNDDIKNTSKQTGISNFEELLSDNSNITSESKSVHFNKNNNNLMQQILSSVTTNSIQISQTNENQVLSEESLQILKELPNLSFLRAKVLMFPINIKTNP